MSRAAVLAAPGRVEVVDVADRPPAPGEVAVAVDGCGVCGSNLPLWEGRSWFDYPRPPGAPGHEAWGTIVEVGDGVDGSSVGDPVALLADDAFAERVVVPAADAVALPPALAGRAFPGEAFASAWNAARRSGFDTARRVAVVGTGFLGAVLVSLASAGGAEVVALSRRQTSRALARRLGAVDAVDVDGPLPGAGEFDVVVEAAGLQSTLDLASSLVGEGGRLVIAGYHQDGNRTVDVQAWNWKGIDVVNAHERDRAVVRRGIADVAAFAAGGGLDLDLFLTDALPLDHLDRALGLLRDRPEGFVKATVHP